MSTIINIPARGFDLGASIGGAGGSVVNRVLFVDSSGRVATDSNLSYDGSTFDTETAIISTLSVVEFQQFSADATDTVSYTAIAPKYAFVAAVDNGAYEFQAPPDQVPQLILDLQGAASDIANFDVTLPSMHDGQEITISNFSLNYSVLSLNIGGQSFYEGVSSYALNRKSYIVIKYLDTIAGVVIARGGTFT